MFIPVIKMLCNDSQERLREKRSHPASLFLDYRHSHCHSHFENHCRLSSAASHSYTLLSEKPVY